jgi:hypothetical protein
MPLLPALTLRIARANDSNNKANLEGIVGELLVVDRQIDGGCPSSSSTKKWCSTLPERCSTL